MSIWSLATIGRTANERETTMSLGPNPIEVLKSLNVLVEQYGSDVVNYVNFDRLIRSKSVLDFVRPVVEAHVAETYLPGFRFEDDYHAAWFMKNCTSWPTWVINFPMPQERLDETWVRMILVPDRHHYLAEVAAALQQFDQRAAETIREFNAIKERGVAREISIAAQKIEIIRALRGLPPGPVKGERGLMAMGAWPRRFPERFAEFKLPRHGTSVIRIAGTAAAKRKVREESAPPSGWQISQITYIGDIPNHDAQDQQAWKDFTRGYIEIWQWQQVNGTPSPSRTKLTFREPANPDSWARKWKKHMHPFCP